MWVIYAIVLVTAIVLTLAFFLRLAGANPEADFVEWVYRSAERAMRPFRGIFPTQPIGDASVLDTSLLFAAVFYFVVALLVDILLRWLTQRLHREERDISQARSQADLVAQQAAAQQYAADQAVHQAAAREYAAQQAAAQQYAIAQAAARDVMAEQARQPTFPQPNQPTRPPTTSGENVDPPPMSPPAGGPLRDGHAAVVGASESTRRRGDPLSAGGREPSGRSAEQLGLGRGELLVAEEALGLQLGELVELGDDVVAGRRGSAAAGGGGGAACGVAACWAAAASADSWAFSSWWRRTPPLTAVAVPATTAVVAAAPRSPRRPTRLPGRIIITVSFEAVNSATVLARSPVLTRCCHAG